MHMNILHNESLGLTQRFMYMHASTLGHVSRKISMNRLITMGIHGVKVVDIEDDIRGSNPYLKSLFIDCGFRVLSGSILCLLKFY